MQSAVEHVLAVLDRAHTPGRVAQGVAWARAAGFDNLSLDLIYGAPGESLADWRISLESALTLAPDHLSAYSLIVEPATPLARRLAAGELDLPDDDDLADKYLLADQLLSTAGLTWYEVSNWATPGMACRHNLSYWRGADWWGLGAGAHSHLAGHRWWNLRRPAAYTARLAAGRPPQAGSEHLTPAQRHTEAVMLGLRLAEGLDSGLLSDPEQSRAEEHRQRGHLARHGDRLVCTLPGRLIADALVRDILD
jgi:oxygen-independent coproporphyrinogen-3 oxidase